MKALLFITIMIAAPFASAGSTKLWRQRKTNEEIWQECRGRAKAQFNVCVSLCLMISKRHPEHFGDCRGECAAKALFIPLEGCPRVKSVLSPPPQKPEWRKNRTLFWRWKP